MRALSPTETRTFIENCLSLREIPYIAGAPGIGKSDIVAQVADDFGLKLLDIRLSQMLPEDMTGLPSLNEMTGKALYNPFETFPMENDPIPAGYHGWLIFLDELSSASEEVFAAIYSLLLGHTVGGKKVHPKALIVAAGNRESDSAIARRLPDTLVTRMLPIEMKTTSKEWLKWARGTHNKNTCDSVADFIEKYPDMLISTVDPQTRKELETFQTPRGWGKVMRIVNFHEKVIAKKNAGKTMKDAAGLPTSQPITGGPLTEAIRSMINASVGDLAAKAFKEHYDESMSLPNPWDVAASPSSTKIPATGVGKAKLTASLAEYFESAQDQSREALLTFMNRMDAESRALFTAILKERLGQTQSDQRMLNDVKSRLKVDDIMSPDRLGGDENEDLGF